LLYARDPEIVKRIAITDFDHFSDNAIWPPLTRDMPINDFGIFTATGEEWKKAKKAISPAFSMNQLKNSLSMMNEVSK